VETSRKNGASKPAAERVEASAIRMLSHRSHTRAELWRKLRARGYPADIVDPLLDRFTEIGYLNDEVAVRNWARHRMGEHPMGRRRLAMELRGKGIVPPLLETVLDEFFLEGSEEEFARLAARKRLRGGGGEKDSRSRDRIIRFLLGRGFLQALCVRVAVELCGGEG
jgi:regulatory protein